MAVERTFSIIKPDATEAQSHRRDQCDDRAGRLRIIAQRRVAHHPRAGGDLLRRPPRGLFSRAVRLHDLGPVVVQVLEGDNALSAIATSWARPIRPRRRRNDPQGARQVDRRELGARLRRARDGAKEIAQFFSGNDIVG
jgi:nucleoside-diphosphate kinase